MLIIYEFTFLIFNIFLIIMNNNFLETNNFKFLINHVFNDIRQKTSYDISNNPKYIRIFKKLVKLYIPKMLIKKSIKRIFK